MLIIQKFIIVFFFPSPINYIDMHHTLFHIDKKMSLKTIECVTYVAQNYTIYKLYAIYSK